MVFEFLKEFRKSFEGYRNFKGADRGAELTRMLCDLMGRYNSDHGTNKVRQMEQELEDVTDMMRDNISKVMERGEKIESLIDKTAMLKSESVSFRDKARRHNDEMWWRDQRGRMIFGLLLLCISVVAYWYWQHHKLV